MKCLALFLLSLFSCLLLRANSNTVTDLGNPFSNPVILSHYSVQELQQMKVQDSIKFNSIVYYYTESFVVEPIECEYCPEFNKDLFDISKFEHLRKKSIRYQKVFWKQGYKLTLLSTNELKDKLPIHLPPPPNTNQDDE